MKMKKKRKDYAELLRVATYLAFSIEQAHWCSYGEPNLHAPTPRMDEAVDLLRQWKRENI